LAGAAKLGREQLGEIGAEAGVDAELEEAVDHAEREQPAHVGAPWPEQIDDRGQNEAEAEYAEGVAAADLVADERIDQEAEEAAQAVEHHQHAGERGAEPAL